MGNDYIALDRRKYFIWLPTQEQLWVILPKDGFYDVRWDGFSKGYGGQIDFIESEAGFKVFTNKSLESVLLQMVMCILYNKTWEKGVWV